MERNLAGKKKREKVKKVGRQWRRSAGGGYRGTTTSKYTHPS